MQLSKPLRLLNNILIFILVTCPALHHHIAKKMERAAILSVSRGEVQSTSTSMIGLGM